MRLYNNSQSEFSNIFKLKMTVLLSILFVFFAMTYFTYATCPPGYTTKTTTFDYQGCHVTLTYCYKQMPTGTYHTIMDQIQYSLTDTNCITMNIQNPSFWELVDSAMIAHLGTYVTIPPCPNLALDMQIESTGCWQMIQLHNVDYIEATPCTTLGYCRNYYSICKNYATGEIIKTLDYSTSDVSSNCATTVEWFTDTETGTRYTNCFHTCSY